MVSVACVEGGSVEGCWRRGVEGIEIRRWVASATGRRRNVDSGERCIVVEVGCWC